MFRKFKTLLVITFVIVFIQSCYSYRSPTWYDNIDYPDKGTVVQVHSSPYSDKVEVTRRIKYKQEDYHGEYSGKIKIIRSGGREKEFGVSSHSWKNPESIDFYLKDLATGSEYHYSAMPKGYTTIGLDDDRSTVTYDTPAKHWSLIVKLSNGKYRLIGSNSIGTVTSRMDELPLLYLGYLAAERHW